MEIKKILFLSLISTHPGEEELLKEGLAADVVIFDEKEVQDMATFQDPHQYSKGFKYVIVNGKTVVENGNHTGVKSGAILTGPGTNKIL